MIEENRPSLFWVIRTDYLSNLGFLFPLVMWGIVTFNYFMGEPVSQNYFLTVIGFTVAGVLVLAWCYLIILRIFNDGQSTTATIDGVGFFRGRGQISYVYTYQGEKYLGRNVISRNGRTKRLLPGDKVTVYVDSNNPKRAYIRELYIK